MIVTICTHSHAVSLQQGGKDLALFSVGLGGRASGIGGAYSALSSESDAPYWNAAGMMFGRSFDVSSMQTKLPSDLNIYYLSATVKNRVNGPSEGAWGFYWINGSLPDIPRVTDNESASHNTDVKPSGTFAYTSQTLGISYANWLSTNVSYGINITGFYQAFSDIQNGRGLGASFTPSLLWMPTPRIMVGVVFRDLLNSQKWDTGSSDDIIPEGRIGVSVGILESLLITVETRQKFRNGYSATLHFGTEYNFGLLRLRGGFDEDHTTAGCGLYTGPIDVQYAYISNTDMGIGDTHRVSVGFGI